MIGKGYFYTTELIPVENVEHLVVFTTRDARHLGVEYQTETDHSFRVTLIPFVTVIANKVDLPASCLSRPKEVVATLTVNTSHDGILRLSTTKEWSLRPEEIMIKKGEQEIQISLNTAKELSAGNLSVDLFMEGENKLMIQSGNRLVLNVDVPGVGERCRIPIQFGGGLLVLVLVGMAAVTRARKATRPLPVGGTLRYWEIGKSDMSTEIDLTAFNKNALLIGSGATCDVMIPTAGLELEHALIVAKKTADDVEIFLEPVGEVQKGYGKQITPFALRHGAIFRMGAREFQYLSDNGE